MFSTVRNVLRLSSITTGNLARTILPSEIQPRMFHLTSLSFYKKEDMKSLREHREQSVKSRSTGDDFGGFSFEDSTGNHFPDINTPEQLFDGVPFKYLPTFNIKACKNNTIISVSDYKGRILILKSCGTEGYKTARKGTNVAAQATGYAVSKEAALKGIRTGRVKIQGIGVGRMASIKGLQTGGTNIVSITDTTPVSWCPPRPRKRRRV